MNDRTETTMKLVEYIAKSLVDDPGEVSVEEVEDDRGSIISLSVPEKDLGIVIGRNGKTARAIRAVLSAASTKTGRQTLLKIVE